MRYEEKERLNHQTQKKYLTLRFKNGCKAFWEKTSCKVILFAFYPLPILIWFLFKNHLGLEDIPLVSPVLFALVDLLLPVLLIGGTLAILILFGTPFGFDRTANELRRIGMTNSVGEVPMLLTRTRDKKHEHVEIFEFDTVGIPLTDWEKCRGHIEAALNVNIVKITEGRNKRRILLHVVSAGRGMPDFLEWNDKYLTEDDSTLVLGESQTGLVKVDLSKIPHVLLGGSTGSGKSILLKVLLVQSLKKGAKVSIADFKGGVDFPRVWHDKCRMCFDEDTLLTILTELTEELERRKTVFREAVCANLNEYNKHSAVPLKRHFFACDEVAEVLDKTGLTKEQKERIGLIENRLSVIARQGRAFGIHLILATQRPDANILSGQIRNNINCRICGRADTILSQIILDNTSAAEQIPKDIAGRFIDHNGTVFQGFWIDERSL
ncbi:MAG: DNA translocase FtsK [Ruminococcaceae bacterium]|nr:DNA translocase FtsK [Oscillospiraceae bacterium]